MLAPATMLWLFEVCTASTYGIGRAKTYNYILLDEKSVIDGHRCHMAAKFVY